jgi:hypothetical protein
LRASGSVGQAATMAAESGGRFEAARRPCAANAGVPRRNFFAGFVVASIPWRFANPSYHTLGLREPTSPWIGVESGRRGPIDVCDPGSYIRLCG